MHVMIVTFSLSGINETEYFTLCDQLAPAFADLPGLASKSWLADSESNTYGGVYTWNSLQELEEFKTTDLFNSVATHPNLSNTSAREFSIMDAPTQVTRGMTKTVA